MSLRHWTERSPQVRATPSEWLYCCPLKSRVDEAKGLPGSLVDSGARSSETADHLALVAGELDPPGELAAGRAGTGEAWRACRHTGGRLLSLKMPNGRLVRLRLERRHPVTFHADDGPRSGTDIVAIEGSRAVVEEPAVGCAEPVAATVGHCRNSDDGLGQLRPAGRTEVPGVTVGENPSIGRNEPVPAVVGC